MDVFCQELVEIEDDGWFTTCGKNGEEAYNGFIYPLIRNIAKEVCNDYYNLFFSVREYGGRVWRVFLWQLSVFMKKRSKVLALLKKLSFWYNSLRAYREKGVLFSTKGACII